ncbi:DUF2207 domain-containing protein [Cerasibacillus terrae]|uniref:DUF2207 domain-containing protein n=1 Tax=Cerasibacillus terrae TaxID=2498845 RepID=A0A5C8NT51_9BACI|nr:DUF2207 domain-containing protein [Cerasibacillus terrae]TXL64015.1 DUF2207 domain-containing protein [Cerasibacillus terrae]
MKKILASFLLIFLLGVLFFPIQAFALDYSIDQTDIHAYLKENGDVKVKESHTYHFEDDFNGISRTLIPKKNTEVKNFQATENGKKLKIENDDNLYKVHRTGDEGETLTIELTYDIKNGVEVYEDMAQFYWPFFDESNETDYENMTIYVHPPHVTNDVLSIGYDAALQSDTVKSDGVVQFDLGYVGSGENGDIRVAYDTQLFPAVTNHINQSIRNEIQKEIETQKEEIATFEKRQTMLNKLAPFVIGIFAIYLLILIGKAWIQRRMLKYEAERLCISDSFMPKNEMSMPATIRYMSNGYLTVDALTAALLDLVRKGYVKQTEEGSVFVVQEETEHDHEKKLIDWLFYEIGDSGKFTINDLEDYTENEENHESYQEDFDAWRDAVNDEMKSNHLFEDKTKMKWITAGIIFLLLPFIIVFAVYELFSWMTFGIVLFVMGLLFSIFYKMKTVKGEHITIQWKEFQDKYEAVTPSEWTEWLDDDQMRAFIYGLGMNSKKIRNKSETLANEVQVYNTSNTDIWMMILLASAISDPFSNAEKVSAATITSDGGAGVGSGSGVGGGGGGSGAF